MISFTSFAHLMIASASAPQGGTCASRLKHQSIAVTINTSTSDDQRPNQANNSKRTLNTSTLGRGNTRPFFNMVIIKSKLQQERPASWRKYGCALTRRSVVDCCSKSPKLKKPLTNGASSQNEKVTTKRPAGGSLRAQHQSQQAAIVGRSR